MVGFGSGIGKKKSGSRFGLGRSVEIFNQVFPGTLFTLGYLRNLGILVFQKCRVYPKYWVIPDT